MKRAEKEDFTGLVRLLNIHRKLRTPEDVFEIANSLYRASFVRQLDVDTRSGIARYAEAFEIIPGEHVPLCEDGENDLFIILSGSVKAEAAGLEFLPGDTFGFRAPTSPSYQLMTETPVVTCASRGLAAKVPFEYCVEFWPDMDDSDSDDSQQKQSESGKDPGQDLVWSPELARSILLRGGAEGEEALVALEYLNFPPINGHSTEVREILVSEFKMRRDVEGSVFLEWTNRMPINPNDIQLSRVDCDQVVMVVSGCLKATCRRKKREGKKHGGERRKSKTSNGEQEGAHNTDRDDLPSQKIKDNSEDARSSNNDVLDNDGGDDSRDASDADGEFTLMRLHAGDVFPPQSGLMMMGSRLRKDKSDFDQEVEEEWEDFDICALVGDSSASTTEILLVDAHVFHDVIYPGIDLFYSMEPVRSILSKGPGLRTWREINYIARNVLSHHVAFQQMSSSSLERIASRLTDRIVVHGGEVLVEYGESVSSFLILLRGSARIMEISKAMKARSTTRRAKVGRLEPGDLWGMQHTHEGAEANFEIVAVEGCELIRGDIELIRAAEKQACVHIPVGARAMRSLAVLPEKRTRRDLKNIVDELSTPKSGLDVARFRRIPICLKTRVAAALRLEVWPAFLELKRDEKKDPNTYFFIIKGSISLQAITKANRFTMETLDMPAAGQLKSLDVDNGLALEDWRASGLGPCVAIHYDRQVVGEYPHSDENMSRVRAVTRQETTAAVVDGDVYAEHLLNDGMNYSDSHSEVCREVLAQLKTYPRDYPGVGGLESDILCRLLKENPVLKRISTSCLPRLTGSIALKRYDAGEVVTEAEDYGDNLFIILEGFLEYAVQESHRGVMDRSLAKEVGIAPGLRCVGVMTAGDFFAPESMLGRRRGQRPRVLNHGSYRIRCSPDLMEGDTGDGGAICLVLPREKVEVAVHRDRQVQRSRLLQIGAVPVAMPQGERQATPGQQATVIPANAICLEKISFGGPGEVAELEGPGTDLRTDESDGKAAGEDEWRRQIIEEKLGVGNRATRQTPRGVALANEAGAAFPHRAKLPSQSRTDMMALAAVLASEETRAPDCERQRYRQRQHRRVEKQAFLTGVPSPDARINGPEVPEGVPMRNISTTTAIPLIASDSARDCRGCDTDERARESITGTQRAEESTGTMARHTAKPSRGTTYASVGIRPANGSADVSRGQKEVDDLSAVAGASVWADRSDRFGACCPQAGSSACCEKFGLSQTSSSPCSSTAAAASDKWKSDISSAFVRGEIEVRSDVHPLEVRREDAIAMSALDTTCTISAKIFNNTNNNTHNNKDDDDDDDNDSSSLLDFLRSFVSSHVDPFKLEPGVSEDRAAWVTPRKDASARLLADELTLLGKLSGDTFTDPSGEGDTQLAKNDRERRVMQMTPLWCRQMLPRTTSGCTTARDSACDTFGGDRVVVLGQTSPEAASRAKEANLKRKGKAVIKTDDEEHYNQDPDHHRCSDRPTWRLTEYGAHGTSAVCGGKSTRRDRSRQEGPQRRADCHVSVGRRKHDRFALELEPPRRHRDPHSPLSSYPRGRKEAKHRSLKPKGHVAVVSAVSPVRPPTWSRPSIRVSPEKKASGLEERKAFCTNGNIPSEESNEEEAVDETPSSEGWEGRDDHQDVQSRPRTHDVSERPDQAGSPKHMIEANEFISGVEAGGRNNHRDQRQDRSNSSDSSSGRKSGTRRRSCSNGRDESSSSSSSSKKRNAATASFRWHQETHLPETRQQTQPQQLLVGFFDDKCDDTSFAATGVLAARGTNSARRAAGVSARAAAGTPAGMVMHTKSRAAASVKPDYGVTGYGMIYDTLDQPSLVGCQEQQRPCTGAPSHGWRNTLLSRGGRRGMTDRGSPRKLASRVDPIGTSQLPAGCEVREQCTNSQELERCELLPGVASNNRGLARRSAAVASSRCGVKCRKQPSVVRRLKITLQQLNDPHSGA